MAGLANPSFPQSQRGDAHYRDLESRVLSLSDKYQSTLHELEEATRKISRLKRERGLLLDKIRSLTQPGDLSSDTGLSSSDDEFVLGKTASPSKPSKGTRKPAVVTKVGRTSRERAHQPPSPVDDHQNGIMSGISAGVASARSTKRSKPGRKLQTVPRDAQGALMFPFQVGPVTVHSLGRVEYERDAYHTRAYIFPIGYKASKRYMSIHDPDIDTNWTQTIEDGGEGPRFVLTPEEKPEEPLVGGSCSAVWTQLIRAGYKIRGREFLSNSVSGPEHFGLAIPTIKHLIQELPDARLCKYYDFQVWDSAGTLVDKKDDPTAPPPAKRPRKKKVTDSHQEAQLADTGSPAMSPAGTPGPTSPELLPTEKAPTDESNTMLPPPFKTETNLDVTPNGANQDGGPSGGAASSLYPTFRADISMIMDQPYGSLGASHPVNTTPRLIPRAPEVYGHSPLHINGLLGHNGNNRASQSHSSIASENGDGDRSDMDGVQSGRDLSMEFGSADEDDDLDD
ncbi:hypothetical protein M427DRAFT_52122 [Gonapodya prolifera JEL478]|uniref:FYR N-terminal domain-containing protein n=1 Tax=Gonapodya prolifera (strain JEL478) TaxID=1344416 RepID=A0A139AUW3_GONPJ|nr:hypothetical protein M427DRAFT_52122 [Gonapodya prolifera JEL478]|eukprot:KXS20521.1 hypothetical protein M427DRAFT_52122 [Gonapodya prolifera JEL478]